MSGKFQVSFVNGSPGGLVKKHSMAINPRGGDEGSTWFEDCGFAASAFFERLSDIVFCVRPKLKVV